ncbi:MAG: hypothetical protein ACNYPE_13555 [Candidatus Azotimanducaceae bacterium WSBS_2022_MAG_OTU7]
MVEQCFEQPLVFVEDEIADRVEAMFPPSDKHRELVAGIIPKAKATYYTAFEGFTRVEQIYSIPGRAAECGRVASTQGRVSGQG